MLSVTTTPGRTRLTAVAVLLSITAGMLVAVIEPLAPVEPAAAAPGTPGTPDAPVVLFEEDFQQGAGITELENYVSLSGATYTADPFWLSAASCNGFIVSPAETFPGAPTCSGSASNFQETQRKAAALGLLNTPQNTATNRAVSSNTTGSNGPANARQFVSSQLPIPLDNRFLTFSVDAAATSCGVGNHPQLRFFLTDGAGTETPVSSSSINPCTDARGQQTTISGMVVRYGRFPVTSAILASGPSFGLTIRNLTGSFVGNDGAFDNVRVLDATPQLDKSFSPASVPAGGTSTLTLTVTNTSELTAKAGWSFTDSLPSGLVVDDPANVGGTCAATVGATAGSGSIAVTDGSLAAGQASCTITVDVTSAVAGVYENCAAHITAAVGVDLPACAAVSFVGEPFSCTAGFVYGLDRTGGAILEIEPVTGASRPIATLGSAPDRFVDALAISADGSTAYATYRFGTTAEVLRVDPVTGAQSTVAAVPGNDPDGFDLGAVNPANGYYYFGGRSDSGSVVMHAVDPTTNTYLGVQFILPTTSLGDGANGDLFFDSEGRAYVVLPPASGESTIPLVMIADVPDDGTVAEARVIAELESSTTAPEGVAVGGHGYLSVTYAIDGISQISRADPNSGAIDSSGGITGPNGAADRFLSDLASCSLPSTVTLRKHIDGRFTPDDQFDLTLSGNGVAVGNTGTTSGSSTGLQTDTAATAGPVLGVPGRTYAIAETGAAGTDLGNYDSEWQCTDGAAGGVVIAGGAGSTGSVTVPSASGIGSHLECVIINTAHPAWTLAKEALQGGTSLAADARVQPGSTITYRVTAASTTPTDVPDIELTDDLGDVLDDAHFVGGSARLTIDGGPSIAVPDPVGDILTTGRFTLPGATIAVLTYDVVVDADAWSARLTNLVVGDAPTAAPSGCPTECITTQFTPTPVQILKVGEDAAGDVVPMSGSQWAIYVAPTDGAPVVDAVPAVEEGGDPVPGLFRDTTLEPGTYWLEETVALDGFALLAERIAFTLDADGEISLAPTGSSHVTLVQLEGVTTIRVQDVPSVALPAAGGTGTSWFTLLGIALVATGLMAAGLLVIGRLRHPLSPESCKRL